MTNEEQRHESALRLRNYYIQIHVTVIFENDFVSKLGGYRALEYYRDEILDNINRERRQLGFIN